MHSPSARVLHHLDRYCIVLVRTLKHISPAKCDITTPEYICNCVLACYNTIVTSLQTTQAVQHGGGGGACIRNCRNFVPKRRGSVKSRGAYNRASTICRFYV